MSRPPRRKRPSRVHRWEGLIQDVEGDRFGARLIRLGKGAPDRWASELWAEFDLKHLPDAQPGDPFNLYVHRRGKKVRTVPRRRDLGVWTEEDLAAAKAEGERLAALFGAGSDR